MTVMTALAAPAAAPDRFVNDLFTAKIRRGIFAPIGRYLTGFPDAEDRLQEGICATWWFFRRTYVEKGKLVDDALLVYHCRLRAIDHRHRFVPGHRARRADDVYHPHARTKGIRLTASTDLTPLVAQSEHLDSALDLRTLHDTLDPIGQAVLAGNMKGETTTEIARGLGMSISGVHRRERLLGRQLLREHARG